MGVRVWGITMETDEGLTTTFALMGGNEAVKVTSQQPFATCLLLIMPTFVAVGFAIRVQSKHGNQTRQGFSITRQ